MWERVRTLVPNVGGTGGGLQGCDEGGLQKFRASESRSEYTLSTLQSRTQPLQSRRRGKEGARVVATS
eukprot:11084839-Alexandrium_andersonii.AAC.1